MSGQPDRPLEGQGAVVTGGTRGIGAAVTRALARDGASVLISGTTQDGVDTAVKGFAAEGLPGRGVVARVQDAGEVAARVRQAVEDLPGLHIVVNNAGIGGGGHTHDLPYEHWAQLIEVNLSGAFRVTHEVLRRSAMRSSGYGRIINIASTGGKQGVRYAAAYTASKHGLVGLSKSLGLELAGTGITVNAVCPGFVETDLSVGARRRYAAVYGTTEQDVLDMHNARIPIGRHVRPDEVARLVRFLADPASSSFTAQAINVCGGLGNY